MELKKIQKIIHFYLNARKETVDMVFGYLDRNGIKTIDDLKKIIRKFFASKYISEKEYEELAYSQLILLINKRYYEDTEHIDELDIVFRQIKLLNKLAFNKKLYVFNSEINYENPRIWGKRSTSSCGDILDYCKEDGMKYHSSKFRLKYKVVEYDEQVGSDDEQGFCLITGYASELIELIREYLIPFPDGVSDELYKVNISSLVEGVKNLRINVR